MQHRGVMPQPPAASGTSNLARLIQDPPLLKPLVRSYLANPFSSPPPDISSGLLDVSDGELVSAANALCVAGHGRDASRLLLAAGHDRILRGIEAVPVSPFDVLGDAAVAQFGVTKEDARALLHAARRVFRRLNAIAGVSTAIQRVRAEIWSACFGPSLEETLRLRQFIRDQNVLILGETGTGKELAARAIQESALNRGASPAPMQTVNAAAMPAHLVESELFGHVKGAFTGADATRTGKIVAASGGTLFLDEIGDLPASIQAKLLRAVETNRIAPVGSNKEVVVDVRYIAATSRPIRDMVVSGAFGRDLYERLAGSVISIPPLRDRPEDIAPIGHAMLEHLVRDNNIEWTTHLSLVAGELEQWFKNEAPRHSWPGNVRELENVIRARLLSAVRSQSPARQAAEGEERAAVDVPERILQCKASLDEVRDWYVRRVVEAMKGHKNKASHLLGIDRGTLNRFLKGSAGSDEGSGQ